MAPCVALAEVAMLRILRNYLAAIAVCLASIQSGSVFGQDAPTSGFEVAKPADPVATAAYGKLFDAGGKEIKPTPETVRRIVDFYIDRLLAEAEPAVRDALGEKRVMLVKEPRADDMTARFLLFEWLTETVAPADRAQLFAKNRTLRMAWYKDVLGEKEFWATVDKASGLPRDVLEILNKNGMARKATMATGAQYIRECANAGVPTPPTWGEEGPGKWNLVGDLNPNFLGSGNPARIYRFDSQSPEGLCVALPRINGNTISLLGVICLGKKSSNACFYDNANVAVGDKVPMDQFLSGGNLGDVCSDCHAGENPYVVHPASFLNMAPANHPENWYTPLVRPDWPQNPGPSGLLGQVAINELPPVRDGSCLSCHEQGNAGRFPDILELNRVMGGTSGYCSAVVSNAIGNTMPGGPPYQKHINAMRAFCRQSTPPGGIVDLPDVKDDPKVVSPPLVIGPLYACTQAVEVKGAIYGAKLVVRINGADRAAVQVTKPSSLIVQTGALVAGDVVDAFQDVNGIVSGPSPSVTVEDHQVAYPSGLPLPRIDPTLIHQCGHTIAVRHVRGALVTVLTNNASPAAYGTGGDWTNLPPAIRPFNLGDSYTARQQMCTDISGDSAPEQAVAPPSPMPVPVIDPPAPVAGQQLVTLRSLANGALTSVLEQNAGTLVEFSTAENWRPEVDVATGLGRPLQSGDRLTVVSKLCDGVKVDVPDVTECRPLPAPVVVRPLVGDVFLAVTSSVPSARIQVYDAGLSKIGDGSGSLIGLTRAVAAGDVLTVTQSIGNCASASAYQVTAICASEKCQ